ncbi:MAG: selenide, water dikinase SelD [Candidatus Competibacteraceae bacterium]|nr:selenide, water dikinase SelD [Candidatus Competibacteraceae bacterium]
MKKNSDIKLTAYSHGAGCGCKLSPGVLSEIISQTRQSQTSYPQLLVGNATRDDAAVYQIGDNEAIISTTDFFMPIVDSAFDFGRIASANALSDVYAMGGKPIMAIAILGWPAQTLPPELAAEVLQGAEKICHQAGIPLAGGHSIDNPEPIFGLAVTGMVKLQNLKKNNTAKTGDCIFLTKPLGIGILSTAIKKGMITNAHLQEAIECMTTLNQSGLHMGSLDYVHALTDVTGFGLLGHLGEVCNGSNASAIIHESNIPVIPSAYEYLEKGAIPGGTERNWKSYGKQMSDLSERHKNLFADPQTSGGLLACVDTAHKNDFENEMKAIGQPVYCIGEIVPKTKNLITITMM